MTNSGKRQGSPNGSEEVLLQARSASSRLFQLDALRGLAAFCVIWYHFRLALPSVRSHNPFVVVFTSGHQAVVLFFVLSGFVLGMPFWAGKQSPYLPYLRRRFFRIYLPYGAALLFAWAVASRFLYSALPLTPWFHLTWQSPLTLGLFVRELCMSTTPAVNTAFWSLRLEAEFSILLPLFCWLTIRLRAPGILTLCTLSYIASASLSGEAVTLRLKYYPMFFLGLLLSCYRAPIAALWKRLPAAVPWALLCLGVCLYLHVLPVPTKAEDPITSIGSCLLILCALYSRRITRALRHGVAEYLGRISFSLYLVHGTVLFAFLNLLYGHLSIPALCTAYGIASLLIAHVFCVYVEEPAISLGRRLTRSSGTGSPAPAPAQQTSVTV